MSEAKQPKSLQEMADEAKPNPLACPRCGCCDWASWPVENTYIVKAGTRTRRRICRHCKQSSVTTDEKPREK